MFVIIVDIVVKAGFEDLFKAAVLRQGQTSMSLEKGCMRFDVLQSPGEPRRFTLCEAYPDEATFEGVHRTTPYFTSYAETTAPWVESKTARKYSRIWPE